MVLRGGATTSFGDDEVKQDSDDSDSIEGRCGFTPMKLTTSKMSKLAKGKDRVGSETQQRRDCDVKSNDSDDSNDDDSNDESMCSGDDNMDASPDDDGEVPFDPFSPENYPKDMYPRQTVAKLKRKLRPKLRKPEPIPGEPYSEKGNRSEEFKDWLR